MDVVHSDIDRFWELWPQLEGGSVEDAAALLETKYLAQGTPGLQDFLNARIESAASLAATIRSKPRYYASLQPIYEMVPSRIAAIEGACKRLCSILSVAKTLDTYLLIGRMNSGGTVSDRGSLIGFEMFGRTDTTPWEELGDWHRSILWSLDQLPELVLHEQAHCNQTSASDGTLLSTAVNEGAADLVVSLLMGPIGDDRYRYGQDHEEELWDRFQLEMNEKDLTNWMYEGENAKDRPADLGYFIGHQICASYYAQRSDRHQALQDILSVNDHRQFLIDSGYRGHGPSELPILEGR